MGDIEKEHLFAGRPELEALLKKYNIPTEKWGLGESKTIEHLIAELDSGEVILVEDGGDLIRLVNGSGLNVYYQDGTDVFRLKEARQVYKDGRTRIRDIDTGIGEKCKFGESPDSAARRALSEELGITEELILIPKTRVVKGPVSSVSYPGLKTKLITEIFDVFLPSHLFKKDGYTEVQEDKTNYYIWEKIR